VREICFLKKYLQEKAVEDSLFYTLGNYFAKMVSLVASLFARCLMSPAIFGANSFVRGIINIMKLISLDFSLPDT